MSTMGLVELEPQKNKKMKNNTLKKYKNLKSPFL